MRINLNATNTRGGMPFEGAGHATVEKDGNNVYLDFSAQRGVVSGDSAIALGQAILETAGLKAAPATEVNIPAGWSLTSQDGGYIITDAAGVVRGNFRPVSKYVSA